PATPGSDRTRTEGIMPATVTCPACERQLRVPLEVIGGQVRCPLCHTVFLTRELPNGEAEAIRLAEVVEVEPPPPQAITHTPPVPPTHPARPPARGAARARPPPARAAPPARGGSAAAPAHRRLRADPLLHRGAARPGRPAGGWIRCRDRSRGPAAVARRRAQ